MDKIELMCQALFQIREMGAWTKPWTNQWRTGISAVQMRCEWEKELINRGNCRDQFIQLNLHFVCISQSDIHRYARAPRDTLPRGRSLIQQPCIHKYSFLSECLISWVSIGCKRAAFHIYLSIEYLIRIESN